MSEKPGGLGFGARLLGEFGDAIFGSDVGG